MRVVTLAVAAAAATVADSAIVRQGMRTDGKPVVVAGTEQIKAEFALNSVDSVKFRPFSDEFVKHALATGIDWRQKVGEWGVAWKGGWLRAPQHSPPSTQGGSVGATGAAVKNRLAGTSQKAGLVAAVADL
jgi:hypothetical protein